MKMKEHFALPVSIENGVLLWEGGFDGEDVAEFASDERAAAAAHAINCHDDLVEALTTLHENVEPPPEKNCSCHIAPPCGDCVEYDALRDALDRARAILTKAKGE